jgi:hypothetical protein
MRKALIAAAAWLGAAGAASAQACLSYSDGLGNTTLTCPDGRSGYLYTAPGAGVAAGMVAGQPYAAQATTLAPPLGPAAGVPSASYIDPPAPPSIGLPALSPAPVQPSPPPERATTLPELGPLAQDYLRQRAADAAHERLLARRRAEAAAKPGPAKTHEPGKAEPAGKPAEKPAP